MLETIDLSEEIKHRIESQITDAKAEVICASNRHYILNVASPNFKDLSAVKQQQIVYACFKDLMSGHDAPVHAIDKMNLTCL